MVSNEDTVGRTKKRESRVSLLWRVIRVEKPRKLLWKVG